MKRFAFAVWLAATPALAQTTDFTTPEGAAFIHASLGGSMLTFQNRDDIDRIYFTGILGWRCGTVAILYGLNDAPPETMFPMEPCHREFRDPNVMDTDSPDFVFYVDVPKESAQKVTVRIIYEDGKTADFVSERAKNLIP